MSAPWRKESARYRAYFRNIIAVYRQRKDVKMFLELILSMITISVFLIFAFKPTFLTIIELVKEIKTKEETITKMDTKIRNLELAEELYGQKQAQIELLKTAVPDNPLPETFVQQIEGLAIKYSVDISGITISNLTLKGKEKPKKEKAKVDQLPQGAGALPFSVSIAGDYQALIAFLSELENFLRPIKVDSSNFISPDNGGQNLVLTIEARAPYLK
jgi:Tfp pilus assembly protein PilO